MCIFEVLNVLFWELEASPVAGCPFLGDKYIANFEIKIKFFSTCKVLGIYLSMIYLYLRWPELAVAGLHHVLEPVPVNALLSQQVVGLKHQPAQLKKNP